jgi:ABC-2 type transport system permease protein
MSRVLVVARREYLERVRSKTFLAATLLGPLLLAGFTVGPGLLMARQRAKPLRVSVLDAGGGLREAVEASLLRRRAEGQPRFTLVAAPAGDAEAARTALSGSVLRGEVDGFLLLPEGALAQGKAEYYGKNVSNFQDIRLLDRAVGEAYVARRLTAAGLDAPGIEAATKGLDLKTIRLTASGAREDTGGSFLLSMVLLTILYTSLLMWGAALMNGVIEEKTNRVVEVVVSSLPTRDLFLGKLMGVGSVALTQFLVWAASLLVVGLYTAGAAAGGGFQLPEISPVMLAAFVTYFVLGFFVYGSLYTAVGASVNNQQEAQNLAFPVMMPLILAFVFFPVVLRSPDGTLAVALSLVPFLTPMLMFLRISVVTPPVWQIALSVVLMLLTIAAVNWLAARIYRVGILMYGKRPTLPEILRWALVR